MKTCPQKKNRAPASRRQANASRSGFTLVETLVAISIFTMSILGMLSVLSQGVADTSYAKAKMTATYLAQEGIEYVRNMRDTSVISGATAQIGWNAFKSSLSSAFCDSGNGCYVNNAAALSACGLSCPKLFYDSLTGKYNYDPSGVDSGFIRKISITTMSADEIKISSAVFWTQSSGPQSVTFSENLFNWVE